MDTVRRGEEVVSVIGINYEYIGEFCNDGITPMPIYQCAREGGGYTSFREEHLELVERGNVWKREAGEKTIFADIGEEAAFHI